MAAKPRRTITSILVFSGIFNDHTIKAGKIPKVQSAIQFKHEPT